MYKKISFFLSIFFVCFSIDGSEADQVIGGLPKEVESEEVGVCFTLQEIGRMRQVSKCCHQLFNTEFVVKHPDSLFYQELEKDYNKCAPVLWDCAVILQKQYRAHKDGFFVRKNVTVNGGVLLDEFKALCACHKERIEKEIKNVRLLVNSEELSTKEIMRYYSGSFLDKEQERCVFQKCIQSNNVALVKHLFNRNNTWHQRVELKDVCRLGDCDLVYEFLSETHSGVHYRDCERYNAVDYACMNDDYSLARFLIDKGATVMGTSLFAFVQNTQLLNWQSHDAPKILDIFDDVNFAEYKISALHHACDRGILELVKWLLQKGADVNAVDNYQRTPIHYAMRQKNCCAVVEELMNAYVNVNPLDGSEKTVLRREDGNKNLLHVACNDSYDDRNYELVKLLVTKGVGVNAVCGDDSKPDCQSAPLHCASRGNNPQIVQFLLDNGARVNDCAGYDTALDIAIEKKNEKVADVLLEHGGCTYEALWLKKAVLRFTAAAGLLCALSYFMNYSKIS